MKLQTTCARLFSIQKIKKASSSLINFTRNWSLVAVTLGSCLSTQALAQLKPFSQSDEIYSNEPIFTIHGSNTIGAKLAPALVSKYLVKKGAENVQVLKTTVENEVVVQGRLPYSGQRVQVLIEAHGSSTGFRGLMSGEADIAASSRQIKTKEIRKLAKISDMTSPESEHVLAIDGLSVIVHPNNPLNELSKDDLSKIFTGQINNWKELGGMFGQINVYARDNNSGTWDSFKGMVLGKDNKLVSSAKRFESNQILSNQVAQDQNGIGFVSLATIGQSKALSIKDGGLALQPTTLTVGTEDYPLARRLYFYSDEDGANGFAKEFLQFARNKQGQETVKEVGFVSQNIRGYEVATLNNYPKDVQNTLKGAERLSVNFRFKEGSAQLDNKAKIDIDRLAQYIKDTNNQKDLVLIGFGDPRKNEKRTVLLSKLRAMAVRRELVKQGIYPNEIKGLGDQLQVASNDKKNSRIKNRRVEVWVR